MPATRTDLPEVPLPEAGETQRVQGVRRDTPFAKRLRRLARLFVLGSFLWLFGLYIATNGPHPVLSAPFEPSLESTRFQFRTLKNPTYAATAKRIVLLPISDATLEDQAICPKGVLSVTRDRHARIVDELSQAGATCIVFDILFESPTQYDTALAAAVERAKARNCQVVWATFINSDEELDSPSGSRLRLPTPTLLKSSHLIGHPRFPLFSEDLPLADRLEPEAKVDGRHVPALAVAAYEVLQKKKSAPALPPLPVEPDDTLTINFLVNPAFLANSEEVMFPRIPYEEVYHGFAHSAWNKRHGYLKGKIVIVGDTTPLLHDAYRTPIGEMPGMEVHAHALAMLLSQSWMRFGSPGLIATIMGGIVCLMIIWGAMVRSWVAIVGGLLFLTGYFVVNIQIFSTTGFLLPVIAPMTFGAFALVGAVAERSWFQDQAKARLDTVVNQYVSDQVSAEGAPRGTVTLVFSDIEDSSELSSHLGERFENLRSDYFRLLREANKEHHGFEVETAGDSLFLVFQHAHDALEFALAAQTAIRTHRWPGGIHRLKIRIGAHTGKPYIRTDRTRLTYRGPDTNKAARVTAYAQGDEILLTQETLAAASVSKPGVFTYEDRGEVTLKGVGPTHLYSLPIP
jgi:class 3 adenylate cyclase/CHASE2 domain-containing sensor protein